MSNLAFEDYRAIHAVNVSSLKQMRESPLHYWHAVNAPAVESPALFLGSATHCAVLEPERFAREYVSAPEFGDLRFKENKARRDEWKASNGGKLTLAADEYERLTSMRECVLAHDVARELLSEGRPEVTLTWTDPRTRIACKGRLDWLRDDCIVGLKTTKNNNFRAFQSSVESYGYLLQWAWYQWGYQLDQNMKGRANRRMIEICVESTAPHDVVVYEVPQELLDDALDECMELLAMVAECKRTDRWPGRAPGIVQFKRAVWAGQREEEEIEL